MAREFKETAHLNTDLNAYSEGWERIFAKKENRCDCHQYEERVCDICQSVSGSDIDSDNNKIENN